MKKTIVQIIAIACLMVISFSTSALSNMQCTESVSIENEKNAVDTDSQPSDSTNPQTFNSDIQQVSKSDVTGNTDKVDDSSKIQYEQTLGKCEFTAGSTEINQSWIFVLPAPPPDGRIFLRSFAGAEDSIPYIPTENPKTSSRTSIVPPELDN